MKATALRLLAIGTGIVLLAAAYSKIHSPAVMTESARAFLASLTPEERARATFQFADDERFNWHYIPKVRKGLPFKDMNSAQKHLAHALLSAGLSQRGYIKAITIMSLDEVLKALEKGSGPVRDPEVKWHARGGLDRSGSRLPEGSAFRDDSSGTPSNLATMQSRRYSRQATSVSRSPASMFGGRRSGTA